MAPSSPTARPARPDEDALPKALLAAYEAAIVGADAAVSEAAVSEALANLTSERGTVANNEILKVLELNHEINIAPNIAPDGALRTCDAPPWPGLVCL